MPAAAHASAKLGGSVDEATITPSTLYLSSISSATSVLMPPDKLASSGRRPNCCRRRVNKSKISMNSGLSNALEINPINSVRLVMRLRAIAFG